MQSTSTKAPNEQAAPYLLLDGISVSFGDTDVVRALSMRLEQGEIGCLLGFSGCGKTTALRAIAGLEQPKHGMVKLNGKTLTNIKEGKVYKQVEPAKRDMGMVFQDYALFTHLSVSENIGFGLHRWSKADKAARIKEVLEEKGIKQTWLAEQLGKSYNMVNGYVQNRQQPRLEVLYEIARILDVEVKDLLIEQKDKK